MELAVESRKIIIFYRKKPAFPTLGKVKIDRKLRFPTLGKVKIDRKPRFPTLGKVKIDRKQRFPTLGKVKIDRKLRFGAPRERRKEQKDKCQKRRFPHSTCCWNSAVYHFEENT